MKPAAASGRHPPPYICMSEKHQATGSEDVPQGSATIINRLRGTVPAELLHHLVHYRGCALRGEGIPHVLSRNWMRANSECGLGKFGYASAQRCRANSSRSVQKLHFTCWRRTRACHVGGKGHCLPEL